MKRKEPQRNPTTAPTVEIEDGTLTFITPCDGLPQWHLSATNHQRGRFFAQRKKFVTFFSGFFLFVIAKCYIFAALNYNLTMKKNCLNLLLILLLCMAGKIASAHDIEVANADGVMIYYNYINDGTELAVTPQYGHRSGYWGTVVIPDEVKINDQTLKVTSIEKGAFAGSIGLTSVSIGNHVKTIGEGAFYNCADMTSVIIGNSVTTIGELAFWNCMGLTSVSIPNSVMTIGKYAFQDCGNLSAVSIGNNVTTIGDFAFQGCIKLSSVTIPNSITTIGMYAFQDCWGLTSAIIGNGVTDIGEYAFKHCQSLVFVSIGSSLTSIEANWFAECPVSKVELNSNAIASQNYSDGSSIGKKYFGNVKEIIIGEGVTAIGDNAFNGCSKVDISSTVCKMGKRLFSGRAKIDVTCRATTIPETDDDTFTTYNLRYSTLHVPEDCLEAYRTTAPWSGFNAIVPITSTGVTAPTATRQSAVAECYDMGGRRVSQPRRGVNIVKMNDGTTKKIVVR